MYSGLSSSTMICSHCPYAAFRYQESHGDKGYLGRWHVSQFKDHAAATRSGPFSEEKMVQGAASIIHCCKMAEMRHLHADANLGCSQAYARSLSHGCHHVGHQLTQLLGAKHAFWYFASHLHVLRCELCSNAGGMAVLQATCDEKGSSLVSRPC